jgi:Tfp pilus assembly protein PilF
MRGVLSFLVLVSGCAAVAPAPSPTVPSSPPSENAAVARLVKVARGESDAGRHASAAASLERALRIEPRNARLWHELARVRLKQGEHAQAEASARRSNAWAGSDAALRAENARLIEEARTPATRGSGRGRP